MQALNIIPVPNNEQGYGEAIWTRTLSNLKQLIKADQFKTWLDDAKFLTLSEDTLIISVKTNFVREWLINNYFLMIKQEIAKIDGKIKKFSVKVDQDIEKKCEVSQSYDKADIHHNVFSRLNPKFTFKNYVVGASNHLAYEISKDISSQNIPYSHNSIFYIHSHVGMGKTHLLQSIAEEMTRNSPSHKVGYLSAEKFMHNFVNAVKNNTLFELRNKINEIDTFLIDDIQFICGKESTQKEFTLTLNSIIEFGKTIVIASSLPAHMLDLADERTKSLLISSNTVHINSPDHQLRLEILEHYNANNTIKFNSQILNLIAEKITTNVRELEAALNNLTTYLSISGKEASVENICLYIHNYMKSSFKKITTENIIKSVAKFYRVSNADILSKKRTQKLVLAREIIAYLAKEITSDSLKLIGEKIGNRNHATVLYYLNKLQPLINNDSNLAGHINTIKSSISV
ncbi:chromosomal replication initiator protein DnaA [Candidatus Bandiella euplotis]|uniref:Chromosomal replication initiator protein DnaA n=1 Tax=Candidatus Bandiella euplotis TaxID=1664265 RepID=A0ABZ0UIG5_9RICK|nr:chromosomal replication initiator protein DnaA [Candidatus Bandiella woodruffii]WPX95903.1 Chromosomal replication initiator protein DnaA [Candidatus Bandiella woodruffii]